MTSAEFIELLKREQASLMREFLGAGVIVFPDDLPTFLEEQRERITNAVGTGLGSAFDYDGGKK